MSWELRDNSIWDVFTNGLGMRSHIATVHPVMGGSQKKNALIIVQAKAMFDTLKAIREVATTMEDGQRIVDLVNAVVENSEEEP